MQKPANPNATESAKRLLNYLSETSVENLKAMYNSGYSGCANDFSIT